MENPYLNSLLPSINREQKRKIDRYRKDHPNMSLTEVYNLLFTKQTKEEKARALRKKYIKSEENE